MYEFQAILICAAIIFAVLSIRYAHFLMTPSIIKKKEIKLKDIHHSCQNLKD